MKAHAEIAVSVGCPRWAAALPEAEALSRRAAAAALAGAGRAGITLPPAAELSLVLADDKLVRRLNRDYRRQDKATNVLSFPALEPALLGPRRPPASARRTRAAGTPGTATRRPAVPPLLGDVIVAFETIRGEAVDQGKPLAHHLAHLIVHGTLHLLGYDHAEAAQAERMERLECDILAGLGIPDPYGSAAHAPRRAPRAPARRGRVGGALRRAGKAGHG